MTVTAAEVSQFALDNLAVGIITSFGTSTIGLCEFKQTFTYSSGSMNGLTVNVMPLTVSVNSPSVQDGIMRLPGGRVYSPWSLAGERAPTSYPTYTQRILYHGHVRPVEFEYRKLLQLVGVSSNLNFEYGRASTENYFSAKTCRAMLLPINSIAERVMYPTGAPKTWIEITATWQQVQDFNS
jgi:hypothetical protein